VRPLSAVEKFFVNGWYAIETDGKVLRKGGKVSWFATAMDACRALEKEIILR
jgi:hypothetical protein